MIARAQMMTFSRQDLIDYTAQNPFDRFPDGRPKVPDDLIERALRETGVRYKSVVRDTDLPYAGGDQLAHDIRVPNGDLQGNAGTHAVAEDIGGSETQLLNRGGDVVRVEGRVARRHRQRARPSR